MGTPILNPLLNQFQVASLLQRAYSDPPPGVYTQKVSTLGPKQ